MEPGSSSDGADSVGPPSVATPGNPSTPADSSYNDYEYTPQESYASNTPDTYNAYGGQTPGGTTPHEQPMTPGDAYTPSTPAGEGYTPVGDSYTPQGSYTPNADAGGKSWHCPGIYVKCGDITGVIVDVGADNCTVRQPSGEEIQLPKFDLEPVRPSTKSDWVKVLEDKEYRDTIGQVLNFEDMEVIVKLKLSHAEDLVRILEKECLAKFDPSFQ